ncbi:MAG: calcium-binding protein [Alphaproteobacteria bacterium]|nr:calcium-binding protein [Alphaproteobacteria bacterium]
MAIVIGTNGADDLDGTANNDLIISGNGADTINAGDGNDLIFSGRGDDTIDAGDGNDVVFAGNGDDTVDGGDGHDLIFGGRGDDTINGGAGNDLIFGGKGDDIIDGGEGCDVISAGSGNDIVIFDVDENSGAQNYFSGGSGNDTLRLRLTQAQVNEMTTAGVFAAFNAHVGSSGGFDFSTFGLSFSINLKVWRFEQIEVELTSLPGLFTENNDTFDFNTVIAGTYEDGTQYDGLGGDDTVILANDAAAAAAAGYVVGTAFNAGTGNDTVTGGTLDDIINGDAGNDVLNGGTGADTLNGGDDDDTIIVADGGDAIDGGAGIDELQVSSNLDANINLDNGQTIIGGASGTVTGIENVTTGGGNDVITGDAADNVINTGTGNDQVYVSAGTDTLNGGTGDNFLVARAGAAVATVNLTTGDASLAGLGTSTISNFNSVITGDGNDNVTGNGVGNRLYVHAGDNIVFGMAGSDDIIVGDGSNMVDGGADTDILRFSSGPLVDLEVNLDAGTLITSAGGVGTVAAVENVVTNEGNDTITGDANSNFLNGGSGNNIIIGGLGNDVLRAGDGDDDLFGGQGNDNLDGGNGFNRLFAETGTDIVQGGDDGDQVFVEDLNGDNADGGADFDTLIFNFGAGVNINLTTGAASVVGNPGDTGTYTNFEAVASMGGGATIIGTNVRNGLTGNGGTNTINGLDGDDTISVNGVGDMIDGGAGFDDVIFATSNDVTVNLVAGTTDILGTMGTVSSIEGLITGAGNDQIAGDGANNHIAGEGGNDTIAAGDGNDTVLGGAGNDVLNGDAGIDNIKGGDDDDLIIVDEIDGDAIDGEAGNDTVQFRNTPGDVTVNLNLGLASSTALGSNNISLTSIENIDDQSGDTNITGSDGNNLILARGGADTIDARDGDDIIIINDSLDSINGGNGTDELRFATSLDVFANLNAGGYDVDGVAGTMLSDIENITGGTGNDALIGDAGDNVIDGGGGNDFIASGTGDDTIFGRAGSDFVSLGDLNNDFADGGDDVDTIQFNTGVSVNLDLATGLATLVVGVGSGTFVNFEGAQIFGAGGATISGTNTSNNISVAGTGNMVTLLDGNDNVDLFAGGNDVNGGAGTFDSVRFNTTSDVTVDLTLAMDHATVDGLSGDVVGFEVIRTGSGDDTLTGTAANDRFEVSTGMDTVNTGAGDDNIFIGDGGGDNIDGGSGLNDGLFVVTSEDITIDLSLAVDNLQVGTDAVSTVTNIENVIAFGGNDTLVGSAARDNLNGGAGNDTITSGLVTAGLTDNIVGGDGDDTLIFNGASVQATGGLGLDSFEFIDYGGGASQFAQLFDVDPTEGDHIDLTGWGITEAQILNGYTDLGADSQVTVGGLTILIRGIDNTEFSSGFFDFV